METKNSTLNSETQVIYQDNACSPSRLNRLDRFGNIGRTRIIDTTGWIFDKPTTELDFNLDEFLAEPLINEQEKDIGISHGLKMDYVYEANELVRSDNTFFIATGVTDGQLLEGVRRKGPMIRTESVIIRGRSGTIRRIIAEHQASRWS